MTGNWKPGSSYLEALSVIVICLGIRTFISVLSEPKSCYLKGFDSQWFPKVVTLQFCLRLSSGSWLGLPEQSLDVLPSISPIWKSNELLLHLLSKFIKYRLVERTSWAATSSSVTLNKKRSIWSVHWSSNDLSGSTNFKDTPGTLYVINLPIHKKPRKIFQKQFEIHLRCFAFGKVITHTNLLRHFPFNSTRVERLKERFVAVNAQTIRKFVLSSSKMLLEFSGVWIQGSEFLCEFFQISIAFLKSPLHSFLFLLQAFDFAFQDCKLKIGWFSSRIPSPRPSRLSLQIPFAFLSRMNVWSHSGRRRFPYFALVVPPKNHPSILRQPPSLESPLLR